jgi:serine/threonine protein kinase/tetratricopeptide (TPR) repeat protein
MTRFSQADWTVISQMLDEALELSAEGRPEWLEKQRALNPELIGEVEALLAREAQIDEESFLTGRKTLDLPTMFTLAGQTLGAWVLDRPIGEGGMGSVWLARRSDGRFEGAAAIKFLSLAVAGPRGEARFRREGSILARFSHPNIARLLDAGVSPTGLPYLVLEYIEGKPIDVWCDERELDVDERLALFQQILGAVAHAHASFIVHRDLKPLNILVKADGTVKLLDFGIAKMLEEGGAMTGAITGSHEAVFTYKYAAPEQLRGDPITTATDVYSLGVVLYELLAGTHPTSAASHTPAEHVVRVLESESRQLSRAVAPSAQLSAEDAQRFAHARGTSPERLHRILAGDLDNIVGKALKKNPADRYGTVEAFSEDIRRHLDHEPVSARADSFAYRARKFVRRNRVPVTFAALAAIGLVGAAVRESRLRARAESEARKAVAVEEYMVSIFSAADPLAPWVDKPNEVSARALLDRGAARMDTSLSKQPEVRAELRSAIGRVYSNLGVLDRASTELRRSLAERRKLYGANSAPVAEAMDQLGELLDKQDSFPQADTMLRSALAVRRKLFGLRNEQTAESLNHLAQLLTDRDAIDEAEPLYRQALAIRRELYGDNDLLVATTRDYLGQMLHAKGADSAAVSQYVQVLATRQRLLGSDHPLTAQTIGEIANSLELMGKYADAEQRYRQALAIERKSLGSAHPIIATTLNNLGQMLFKMGRNAEADSLLREALAINRKLHGENHDAVSANLSNLALIVRERGDFDEAERLLSEALAIDRSLYGPDHENVGFDLNEIAVVMRYKGRSDSAVTILRQVLAMNSSRVIGADSRGSLMTTTNLARALEDVGQLGESEELLRGVLSKFDTTNADQRLGVIPARVGLGRVLNRTHRAKEALPLLRSTVAMSRAQVGADHWRTGEAELVLAESFLALGEADSAEAPLREGRAVLAKARTSHPLLVTEAEAANERRMKMRKGSSAS